MGGRRPGEVVVGGRWVMGGYKKDVDEKKQNSRAH
jgi:hypothetical protein